MSNDLGVNPYLGFGISALVELIAIIIIYFIINIYGRKLPYIICLLIAGISCIAIYLSSFNSKISCLFHYYSRGAN